MKKNFKEQIENIKFRLNIGLIDYYEAKKEAEPIILEMNIKGKEIAKKFGQRFKPFTFAALMR